MRADRPLRKLRVILLLIAALAASARAGGALPAGRPATIANPQVYAVEDTALLGVGRLLIPAIRYRDGYARHYDEQCSGTLVGPAGKAPRSDLVLSAWHCVEHYRDLSRTLEFVSASGERREARVLVSGGSMHSDWVLLRLTGSLPHPVALAASGTDIGGELLMAGYPRGTERARASTARCRTTGRDRRDHRSDCVLQKGASGGAVFPADGGSLVGVISRGDGVSQSIFVPLDRFRARIRPFLPTPPHRSLSN